MKECFKMCSKWKYCVYTYYNNEIQDLILYLIFMIVCVMKGKAVIRKDDIILIYWDENKSMIYLQEKKVGYFYMHRMVSFS